MTSAEPGLVLRARRLRAARGVVVARDVSLTASPGDIVAVEGPNGSGIVDCTGSGQHAIVLVGTSWRTGGGMEIRMVPEVENWLADIRDHDPAVADGIDEAVAALRAGGTSVGPPLVVPVESPPRPGAATPIPGGRSGPPRGRHGRRGRPTARAARWLLAKTAIPGLDAAYERQREMLAPVRRTAADVATSRKRLELQIGQLERQATESGEQDRAPADAEGRLAGLRRQYAALQAEEERVTVASQRLQASVDEFRTRKEAAKAAYLAAQEAAEATWDDVAPGGAASAGADPARGPFWLSELRPAAPESAGTRILFAVEPSGTAVLLAAGTEDDRLHTWYADAIARSRLRYQRKQGR